MTRVVVFVRTTSEVRDAIGGSSPETEDRVSTKGYLEPLTQVGRREETLVDRNTQIGDHLLVVPATSDVDGWDRIEVEGHTFDIIGPPSHFHDPELGAGSHVEMLVREVT